MKLRLNRETIRNLDGTSLKSARGGYPPSAACPVSQVCTPRIITVTTGYTLGQGCVDIGYTKVCH